MTDQPSDGQFPPIGDSILNLPKEGETGRHHIRHPFTTEEDELLKQKVAELGTNAWHEIEAAIPGRNARQCRERWNHYLSPDVENGPWTPEDDQRLLQLYTTIGPKWTEIAKQFQKRTANSIKNRIKVHLRRQRREGTNEALSGHNPTDFLTQVSNLSQVLSNHSFAPIVIENAASQPPFNVEIPSAAQNPEQIYPNSIDIQDVNLPGVPSQVSAVTIPTNPGENVEIPTLTAVDQSEIIVPNSNPQDP